MCYSVKNSVQIATNNTFECVLQVKQGDLFSKQDVQKLLLAYTVPSTLVVQPWTQNSPWSTDVVVSMNL